MSISPSFARGISIGLILAGALAWFGFRSAESPPTRVESKAPVAVSENPPPGTVVLNEPVKIFQKAFWRSPNDADKILHAERREWPGDDGVGKWQWFIVVQPSPELLKYIREDNAFGLTQAKSATRIDDAPDWFAFQSPEVDVLRSPTTNLRFIFVKSGNLLYATDSGSAFRPGAPEMPPPAIKSVASSGRLPTTPPPKAPPH